MSERSRMITYVRMPNSASVDKMLLDNASLKKDIVSAVEDMSIKLNKSKKKKDEALKKNIEEYGLE